MIKRQALFIHCHPKKESFTRAILDESRGVVPDKSWNVQEIDLYSENFSPILTEEEISRRTSFDARVQEFETLVSSSDLLVFVYPDWWGQMPALLKGWVDRVFRQGVAYDYQGDEYMPKTKVPLFNNKTAIVFITSDNTQAGTSQDSIWRTSIGDFTGLRIAALKVFGPLHNSRRSTRLGWLKTTNEVTSKYFLALE
ncbi:MAG: NAD(P)H-dependent oxidoreductase [Spirochaetales bacterium]|nr:NAD(P)H-dependent oxidoreductase [Spirochaetales bacterium]